MPASPEPVASARGAENQGNSGCSRRTWLNTNGTAFSGRAGKFESVHILLTKTSLAKLVFYFVRPSAQISNLTALVRSSVYVAHSQVAGKQLR